MATFTAEDKDNASKFAHYNDTVRALTAMYKKAPHIVSWLKVETRPATQQDYYFPDKLASFARVITVTVTKDACERISCNPYKEDGVCTDKDVASYYRIGDGADYGVQCQPACFNLAAEPKFNVETKQREPDTPLLAYNERECACRLEHAPMRAWLEKPWHRHDTHYKHRVNDMPTGYTRVPDPHSVLGTGYTYVSNPTYCNYFDRSFDTETGDCELTGGLNLSVDLLVGVALLDTAKSLYRQITTGNPLPLPQDLPAIPSSDNMESKYVLDLWKKEINSNFQIPEIYDSIGALHEMFTTQEGRTHRGKRSVLQPDNENEGSVNWTEQSKVFLVGLLKIICTDPEFHMQVTFDIMMDRIMDLLSKQMLRMSEVFAKMATSQIVKSSMKSITMRAATISMQLAIRKYIVGYVFSTAAKTAMRTGAVVLGYVGVAILVLSIVGIVLTFADPYNMQGMGAGFLPKRLYTEAERSLRESLNSSNTDFTFDQLRALVLTHDENASICVQLFSDMYLYLNSLEVNSDGNRIEKGEKIPVADYDANSDAWDTVRNHSVAELYKFNPDKYLQFHDRFLCRSQIVHWLTSYSAIPLVFSALSLASGLYLLCAIFLIITSLMLCSSLLTSGGSGDFLVDIPDKLTRKTEYSTGRKYFKL